MRTSKAICLFIAVLFFSSSSSYTQAVDSVGSVGIFDLLISKNFTEIDVKADLSMLIKNKLASDEYIQGKFTYETKDGVQQTLPMRIKCRGRFRRLKCEFPPLKLKFKKDDLAAHGLNEFNEMKLVTHCMGEKEVSRDLVIRELLAYKIFNILSENSLRAQLVKVNYLNTGGRPKKMKGWGILIEDSDELAYRMKGEKFWRMGIPVDSFDLRQEQITAMFNYMIGNADWSSHMARNLEFIKTGDRIKIVPYDFDFAGMVMAPYAVPNADVGQQLLTDRVYLGHDHPEAIMAETIQHFRDKKSAVLNKVKETKLLTPVARKEVYDYLESFFNTINNEEKAYEVISGSKD
ncbi:MAG: hypothetical protein AAFZ15_30960 [Bacteroidota bacterium]